VASNGFLLILGINLEIFAQLRNSRGVATSVVGFFLCPERATSGPNLFPTQQLLFDLGWPQLGSHVKSKRGKRFKKLWMSLLSYSRRFCLASCTSDLALNDSFTSIYEPIYNSGRPHRCPSCHNGPKGRRAMQTIETLEAVQTDGFSVFK
jgi:hypothetical protein